MTKYVFVDVYKNSPTRISKDTNGGYGTENLFGPGLVSKAAQFFLRSGVFWPNLAFAQLYNEIGNSCQFKDCFYLSGSLKHCLSEFSRLKTDERVYLFVCSSIVCFETELEFIDKVRAQCLENKNIVAIYCGNAAASLSNNIKSSMYILSGCYEFLLDEYKNCSINDIFRPLLDGKVVLNIASRPGDVLSKIQWNKLPVKLNNRLLSTSNIIPYVSTRGCPYSCYVYCTYPATQGRRVYHESVDSVVNKLRSYAHDKPGSHVIFRDPVFSISLDYSIKLLKKIAVEQLDLTFTAELHLKNINEEFCAAAKAANLTWIKVGIESAFENVRTSSGRYSVSNDEQKNKINLAHSYGISVDGMFILCQPTDTIESCMQTIEYSISLGLDMAQFSVFTPYPGTPKFSEFESKITVSKYEKFSQFELIFNHDHITTHEASKLVGLAHRKFYINRMLTKIGLA